MNNHLFNNNISSISEHDIEQRFNTIEQRLDVIEGIVFPLLDNNNSFTSHSQGTMGPMNVGELAGGPGPNQQQHNDTVPLGSTNVEVASINGNATTLGGKRRKTKKQKKTKKRGNKGKRLTKRNRQ